LNEHLNKFKPWIIAVLVVAALLALRRSGAEAWLKIFLENLQSLGPWGQVLFVALYVLACVALLPASVLTLGAGAVYGIGLGFVLVSIASTLGATLAFLLGRGLLREWVRRKCASLPSLAALDAAVARDGLKMVALLRLSPIIPFNLLNFALGLSPIRLRDYVLASWLGMMPGTLLYVYLGSLASTLGTGPRQRSPLEWSFLGLGLLATIAVSWLGARLAKQALARTVEDKRDL
jgi:uncharacterized membrane protein YdjX (TVP38/TMEM64 family)